MSIYVRYATHESGEMGGESERLMRRGRMKGDEIDRYKRRVKQRRCDKVYK